MTILHVETTSLLTTTKFQLYSWNGKKVLDVCLEWQGTVYHRFTFHGATVNKMYILICLQVAVPLKHPEMWESEDWVSLNAMV
jgi:hypothetical protein